jgi:hypothetical protein
MTDETEPMRRTMQAEIYAEIQSNDEDKEHARLIAKYGAGNVWDTNELSAAFEVTGFMAPFCVVKRKSDNMVGTVEFQHHPRFYFNFQEDRR